MIAAILGNVAIDAPVFSRSTWTVRFFPFVLLLCSVTYTVSRAQDVHVQVDPATAKDAIDATHFPTIQMALDHAPDPAPGARLYLHIAPATYRERVWVSPLRPRTTFLGQGKEPGDVVITASQSAKTAGGTFFTESVEVNAPDFQADNVTFENAAGPVGQALALSVNADRAVFKHCRFVGDQDTLFANFGRQYYVDSFLSGGVDFIFGNAAAVFDRSEIHIIRPGYLTAQSRTSSSQNTGYVITRSRVTADNLGGKPFFLGRPWRAYSRVIFMHSELPAQLSPEGWAAWNANTPDVKTPFYAEFDNSGPGTAASSRVPWSHQLKAQEARRFEPEIFLSGDDHWNPVAEAAKLP